MNLSANCKATHTQYKTCYSRYKVPFYLWQNKPVLKHIEISVKSRFHCLSTMDTRSNQYFRKSLVLVYTSQLAWTFQLKAAEMYSEPSRTSKMQLLAKIVNLNPSSGDYFCKKLHLRCSTGFWICLWGNVHNITVLQ